MKFKEIREAYKGNLKDFEYEVNLAVDNPRLVKAVKKNGKQFKRNGRRVMRWSIMKE